MSMRTGTDSHRGLDWIRWAHSLGRTQHKCLNAVRKAALSSLLDLTGVFIPSESCGPTAKLQPETSFICYEY